MAGRAIAPFKKKRDAEAPNQSAEQNKTEATSTPEAPMSLEERIRVRAYEMYLQRNGEDGSEVDDWLRAESEVLGA